MKTKQTIQRICYTPQEVASMTSIPYGTILAEIRAGQLIARKVGTQYYIHRDCLDEYLKCPAQKSQPASTSVPTPANGSSVTVATASELAALAALTSGLRKRSSRNT
jgi:excisionase family DNA binding protein